MMSVKIQAISKNTPDSESNQHSNSTFERKRVTISCNNCRYIHCKCSFFRPCKRCTELGILCTDPAKRRSSKKNSDISSFVNSVGYSIRSMDIPSLMTTRNDFYQQTPPNVGLEKDLELDKAIDELFEISDSIEKCDIKQ